MNDGYRHQTFALKLYQTCEQYLFEYVEMLKVIFAWVVIKVLLLGVMRTIARYEISEEMT